MEVKTESDWIGKGELNQIVNREQRKNTDSDGMTHGSERTLIQMGLWIRNGAYSSRDIFRSKKSIDAYIDVDVDAGLDSPVKIWIIFKTMSISLYNFLFIY